MIQVEFFIRQDFKKICAKAESPYEMVADFLRSEILHPNRGALILHDMDMFRNGNEQSRYLAFNGYALILEPNTIQLQLIYIPERICTVSFNEFYEVFLAWLEFMMENLDAISKPIRTLNSVSDDIKRSLDYIQLKLSQWKSTSY